MALVRLLAAVAAVLSAAAAAAGEHVPTAAESSHEDDSVLSHRMFSNHKHPQHATSRHPGSGPHIKCDSGCLKYPGQTVPCPDPNCTITTPRKWVNTSNPDKSCVMTFLNNLVLRLNGSLQPGCSPNDLRFSIIGDGDSSSIGMFNRSSIVAPILAIEARSLFMNGSASINATTNPTQANSIPEGQITLTIRVSPKANVITNSNNSIVINGSSKIVGARINITAKTKAPQTAYINISKLAYIDASGRISQFHPDGGPPGTPGTCGSTPKEYMGGGGYGGFGSDCPTPPDSVHRRQLSALQALQARSRDRNGGNPCGYINGTCRDGSPGGSSAVLGGAGGGQIHIQADVLTLYGSIRANGGAGPASPTKQVPGGGSGGCISLVLTSADGPLSMPDATGDTSCAGSLCASGGSGNSGGGGGRIMVSAPHNTESTETSWSEQMAHMSAVGGLSAWCFISGTAFSAAAGTKFISNGRPDSLLAIEGEQALGTCLLTFITLPLRFSIGCPRR